MPGTVLGHVFKPGQSGRSNEVAVGLNEILEYLKRDNPQYLWVEKIDACEARDKVPIEKQGDYLAILQDSASVPFELAMNKETNPHISLSQVQAISAPYHKLFLSNPAGNGTLTLIGGRGVQVEPRFRGIEELAARLGSVVTHDRRGDVLWVDDFEDGVAKWEVDLNSGTGNSVTSSAVKARNGSKSMLITNSSDNKSTIVKHRQALPTISPLGYEMSLHMPDGSLDFRMLVSLYDGALFHSAGIQYLEGSTTLRKSIPEFPYWENLDTSFSLDDSSLDTLFHTIKIVLDPQTRTYKRIIEDPVEYQLDGKAYYKAADVSTPAHMQLYILSLGDTGDNDKVYIDDVIFTHKEP